MDIKTIPSKDIKKAFLIDIINSINEGKNLTQFAKSKSISPQKLNYYTRDLKNKGIIKKVGYGVWELTETGKNYTKDTFKKEVRAHAFIWTIEVPFKINWKEHLSKLNIKFELIGTGAPKIYINHKKVWLGRKNIVIYEPQSFISTSPIEARKYAVDSLLTDLKAIQLLLKVNLKTKSGYLFRPKREHYALMKNNLAIQCRKDGTKLYVTDKDGTWMCCDDSYNLDEAEFFTTNKTSGLINSSNAQGFFNEQKETNWEVSPKFVLNTLSQINAIQIETNKQLLEYKEQNRVHLKLIRGFVKENNRWRKEVGYKKIDNLQRNLGDFQ